MPIRLTLAALLLALATAFAAAEPVTLKDTVPHITTVGHARAEVVPDQADIRLAVVNDRREAQEAAAATAKAAADVIAAVKARDIDAKDIKTDFELSARYEETHDTAGRPTSRKLTGYRAVERITIRLHDTGKAGALAREFIDKGANQFEGVFFSYSKKDETRKRLKAEAVRDALAGAKAYTDSIGLGLGRVLQIGDENQGGGYADLPSRRPEPTSSVAIPTEPGVERIGEDVTVIWELEGKAR